MKKLTAWFLLGLALAAVCGGAAGCLSPAQPASQPAPAPSLNESDYSCPNGPRFVPHPRIRRQFRDAQPDVIPALFLGDMVGSFRRGGPSTGRKEVAVHLPESQQIRNKRGRDGSGLCVFSATDMGANFQNVTACIGLRDYMTQFDGGGYPAKLAEYIRKMAAANRMPVPPFVQVTNGDVAALELMLKTGRYPGVTYSGNDGVFYHEPVAHMVNLVFLDAEEAAIQDNNFPGEYLWMSRKDFLDRWGGRVNGGWAFCWLAPPPPPIPVNDSTPSRRGYEAAYDLVTVADKGQALTGQAWNPKPLLAYWLPSEHIPNVIIYWERTQVNGGLRDDPKGGYYLDKGAYRAWDAGTQKWGDWSEPPAAVPAQYTQGRTRNFGVEVEKVAASAAYSIGERDVSRAELTQAVTGTEDGRLGDDTKALRLTVTSKDEAWRKRVIGELRHAGLSERVLVQDYPTGHWAVASVGIRDGILVQEGIDRAGRGKVLLDISPAEYTGPQQVLQAIRRPADGYDPRNNPHPGDWGVSFPLVAGLLLLALAGGFVVLLGIAWAVKAYLNRSQP